MNAARMDGNCNCRWCLRERNARDESGLPIEAVRMILCPECGNKRCPHASDHSYACTRSNDPGQAGSVYGGARIAWTDRAG